MTTITSCKYYRYNNRKSNILSTLSDPINKELLLQLSTFIDLTDSEDSVEEDKEEIDNDATQSLEKDISPIIEVEKEADADEDVVDNAITNVDEKEAEEIKKSDARLDLEDDEIDNQDLVNSTSNQQDKEPVLSTILIKEDLSFLTDALLGILNAEDTTKGALRYALVDNNELWIYYEDDKNLSKIMINIINRLKSAGYNMLEFNRIARSNNAIVFEINKL